MARILEGRNTPTPQEAASFVDKYEELEAKIDALKIEHMNRCRSVREEMKELLDEAKGLGLAKGTVKAIVKARSLEAKAKEAIADLEDDEKEYAVSIRKALGDFADLPLGAAAVEREEGDETTSAVVNAVRGSMTDEEWQRAGEVVE